MRSSLERYTKEGMSPDAIMDAIRQDVLLKFLCFFLGLETSFYSPEKEKYKTGEHVEGNRLCDLLKEFANFVFYDDPAANKLFATSEQVHATATRLEVPDVMKRVHERIDVWTFHKHPLAVKLGLSPTPLPQIEECVEPPKSKEYIDWMS
jgi:hypothetical protein